MRIKKSRIWIFVSLSAVGLLLLSLLAGSVWYLEQLKPYDTSSVKVVRIDIKPGTAAGQISKQLEEQRAIRSALGMNIYMRLHDASRGFQAGVYSVSPASSVEEIVEHLSSGRPDERSVTLYPGAMLMRADRQSDSAKYDIYTTLSKAGYSDADIERALKHDYKSPVLIGRPAGASIEGYVYGDTYFMPVGASAEEVLQRAIDEMWSIVRANNLREKFADRGLSLFEGISLASIVQRESAGCPGEKVCDDQRRIAGVFYNRLERDMPLGSDVTYHYAADIRGVPRDSRLDSSYNTRMHKGLTPGPIASPGLSALNAVADPAPSKYLYFLSGDDDITYFAETVEQHEANIRNHCHEKCLLP